MAPKHPVLKFNNGVEVPILGLGTWKSPVGTVTQAVKDAIDVGYRHIDCALVYQNEKEVGEGIKQKIDEGVVKREELFITSKLWTTYLRPDCVEKGVRRSLSNLGLAYLDLYLIHWPMASKEGDELFPKDANDKLIFSDVSYLETWPAMEQLVEKGLVKSIGLSNFNSQQINEILAIAKIKPVTNQVECHPYLNQKKLKEFCESKNIILTAYSPLGSPDRPWATKEEPILLEDPKVLDIAKKYNKSAAQILIKYQIQRGLITIPKSVTKERIISNADVFNFALDDADIAMLDSFDRGARFCHAIWLKDHKHYPFNIEF